MSNYISYALLWGLWPIIRDGRLEHHFSSEPVVIYLLFQDCPPFQKVTISNKGIQIESLEHEPTKVEIKTERAAVVKGNLSEWAKGLDSVFDVFNSLLKLKNLRALLKLATIATSKKLSKPPTKFFVIQEPNQNLLKTEEFPLQSNQSSSSGFSNSSSEALELSKAPESSDASSTETRLSKGARIWAVLNGKKPDRLPIFTIGVDNQFCDSYYQQVGIPFERLRKYVRLGLSLNAPYHFPVLNEMGFDGNVFWALQPLRIIQGQLYDDFGSKQGFAFHKGAPSPWYVGPGLKSKEDIKKWWDEGFPKPYGKRIFTTIGRLRKKLAKHFDNYCLFSGVNGPFEVLSMPLGFGFMSRLMRPDPALVHEFLDRNWQVSKQGLEYLLKTGQKIVLCGDDYGYNLGLLLREEQWRKFIRPVLENYVKLVHQYGAKFLLHSCGKIKSIFGDLHDIGVDGVQSLNPMFNDLPALQKLYGDQICLLGGIDDTKLLFSASPQEIKKAVTQQCEILGKNGRWIPGPTNFLGNQPVQNIQAMISAIKSFEL